MITHNVGNLVLAYLLEIDRMQELGQKLTHQTEEHNERLGQLYIKADEQIHAEGTAPELD